MSFNQTIKRVSGILVEDDGIIRVMPETLANKIAAGEVVQRPSSVVKELVENAIDSGAGQIHLVLKGAGSELVQVVDNGCGMNPTDAVLCFQRHATSKIRSIDDLESIQTLGFRGEALASIASVAHVEIKTKRRDDASGTRVRFDGGHFVGQEPCATADGTSVAVRNLFYNVPARRNFLKTPATEFKHIIETFQCLALSSPDIGFTLVHDDNEIYRLPAHTSDNALENLRNRAADLFSADLAGNLVDVSETTSYLSAFGLVAHPGFNRRTRGEQFLFVNGRIVRNRYLDHAVTGGYEQSLPEGSFPFYALFLTVDPRHVDVNVHPTKAEVKFDDERGVYGFLRAVVKKALGTADLSPRFDSRPNDPAGGGDSWSNVSAVPRPFQATPASHSGASAYSGFGSDRAWSSPSRFAGGGGSSSFEAPGTLTDRLYGNIPSLLPEGGATIPSKSYEERDAGEQAEATDVLIWQLHDRYILTQIRSGLMIVDQNAAHERILFERALQSLRSGFGLSQQLLFPHTLDFNPADLELLKNLLPDLASLGFDIELFSGRSVVIRGVPTDIRAGDERSILEDVVQQYKAYRDMLHLKGHENLAKSIARRSAIPAGKKLNLKEMRSLIDQLFSCEMPYVCPHGRPTIIKIPVDELEKRFGR